MKNDVEENVILALKESLKVDRIVATLLHQRGINSIESAQEFLRPDLQNLHDPFLMKNMDRAVDRLSQAVRAQCADLDGRARVSDPRSVFARGRCLARPGADR